MSEALGVPREEIAARTTAAVDGVLRDEAQALIERIDRAERLSLVCQLASSAMHELRNPLSVIETSAFVISERAQADARIVKHAKRIADQVALAGHVVSDMLDAARGRPLDPHRVDVGAMVTGAIEQLPAERAARVDAHVPTPPPTVAGDERRLRQVVVNLLQNAFDASSAAARVRVDIDLDDARVRIRVRDHGGGIEPSLLGRLFEPLVTTKAHGTGLGLALSREIVRAHGGNIVASNHPDGGACFDITLDSFREPPTAKVER